MIYSVKISEKAESDLKEIFEYVAFELLSVQTAFDLLERLEKSILNLNQMPNRHIAYEKEPWKSRGLRIMPVGNYIVLYIVDEESAVVNIVRVMYGGREFEAQLNKQ